MPSLWPREGKGKEGRAQVGLEESALCSGHHGRSRWEACLPRLLCELDELLVLPGHRFLSGTLMGLDLDGLCLSKDLPTQFWKQGFELPVIYWGGDLSTGHIGEGVERERAREGERSDKGMSRTDSEQRDPLLLGPSE